MLRSFILVAFASSALSKTVHYDFDIGWVSASPDGYLRPVMGINDQWPIPNIECNIGDTVIVLARNSLGNQTTSLHFHGQTQRGTNVYDGPTGVTQCPIPPGESFTYRFTAEPAGMFWYHAHDAGQYPDGLRGKMIVHDPEWEDALNVDAQYYFSISDWYHKQAVYLTQEILSPNNTNGTLPAPDSILFDDTAHPHQINLEPGKTYLFRVVSVSAQPCIYLEFEAHNITVVGVDGAHTHPKITKALIICAGQRYDIVIEGRSNPQSSYRFFMQLIPSISTAKYAAGFKTLFGTLAYTIKNQILPTSTDPNFPGNFSILNVLDDTTLTPLDNQPLLKPTRFIFETVNQTFYPGIGTRFKLGAEPWVSPQVPTLYTALSVGEAASDVNVYGRGVSPYVIRYGEVVQLVLHNPHPDPHPMHLHGHEFQVVARGFGNWTGNDTSLPAIPMKRDVVSIPGGAYLVIRWSATNPGVWFWHCHIDWHLSAGMASVFIEAPEVLQRTMRIPCEGARLCVNGGLGYKGNCQGSCGDPGRNTTKCRDIWNWKIEGMGAMVGNKGMDRVMEEAGEQNGCYDLIR